MSDHNKYCRAGIFILFFSFFFVAVIQAQDRKRPVGLPPEVMAWTVSTIEPWPPGRYKSYKEAMIDNEIFVPIVFKGGMFTKFEPFNPDSLRFTKSLPPIMQYKGRGNREMFRYYKFKKHLDDISYKFILTNYPEHFKYSVRKLPKAKVKSESIEKPFEQIKFDVKTSMTLPEKVDPIVKFIPDRKYWTSAFAADIKFSQNRSSANWHKGEINNMNIFTNLDISYNFKKNKVSLTNSLKTTLTISNAPKDTLRNYTIGSDEFRFRSNFGLQAIRNWNYSSSVEFITSLGNKYAPNTESLMSAFLSPYTFNYGIGMTYAAKPKMKKKDHAMDISLTLEPLSFKYMNSRKKDVTLLSRFFQKDEDGNYEHVLQTFGSTINMNITAKFGKHIAWTSRFNYFTNYELVRGEFENKFDFYLNRYFATTIYLYLRYDDSVTKVEGSDSYLQINELFSFGFSYRW